MGTRYPLNFGWRFTCTDDPLYAQQACDDSDWEVVDIPHVMRELPMQYASTDSVTGIGWYRRCIELPSTVGTVHLALRFEGVATKASVWVDGIPCGTHEGAFTPFEIDLPPVVLHKQEVVVAIRCDAQEDPLVPPFGHVVDYLVPGGMYREVALLATGAYSIADLFVHSEPMERPEDRELTVHYALRCPEPPGERISLHLRLGDMQGNTIVSSLHDIAGMEGDLHMQAHGVGLWDVEHPLLYAFSATLARDGIPCDDYAIRIGFRDIRFTAKGFFLNGRLLKLRGLNRHQLYPYVGAAMPRRQQYADAEFLQGELGVNVVRTSHYPPSSHFLDKCDELGLLVITELPGWQHIGADPRWKESALRQLREMILRDRNHPSIILWGVRINESADDDAFYGKTNDTACWLDPSRPTGGVRNFGSSHLLEDVYTYNDFLHDGKRPSLADPVRVVGKRPVPYLVTEHTGHMFPARPGDPEPVLTEHALRHARVLDAMYADDRISGAIGWCMSDYQTHSQFGGGDGVCWHGVADMFRIPKYAAYVYASQQERRPVMHVLSQLHIGSHPAHAIGTVWVCTNCESVQLYFRDTLVGSAFPDRSRFPHLLHPPVAFDDLIGNRLDELEGFSKRERDLLRETLNRAATDGFDLPLLMKVRVGLLMKRHALRPSDAVKLFERFVLAWDDRDVQWEFRGVAGGKTVLSTVLRPPRSVHLEIVPDQPAMHTGETYDVVRCVISLRSEAGTLARMSHQAVHVDVEGPAKLIGPADLNLSGGVGACYVRTIGGKGQVRIVVSCPHTKPVSATILVD